MTQLTVRPATAADAAAIQALYQRVSAAGSGLARSPAEITPEYVGQFLTRRLQHGVGLVAEEAGTHRVVGEIHASAAGLHIFARVFGHLTVAVDPAFQGQGLGRRLFATLLARVREEYPAIERVELLVRESNAGAIRLYEQLGFRQEGR
ncbi:MAG: GNAT family N-acetyltransferase, partial [Hymenobacteraceae bacterium]|nr:GNAT family N-acetyltransferase [Hymenobacteraceae bacterium]